MMNTTKRLRILVVEDNDSMREGMVQVLRKEGHKVWEAPGAIEGFSITQKEGIDLVITDYKMDRMTGLDLLKKIKDAKSRIEVIVITAYGTIEIAVEAMKAGAWDFITKPFSKDELILKVRRVAEVILERQRVDRLSEENRYLKEEADIRFNYGEIVGESEKMKEIYHTIEKVAGSDTSVLIYGDSGTGKELVARAIHYNSPRKEAPFIRVNCGALAEGVLESELFGHERGAFTNALRQKKGRFELADRGTLFLDEIGDIPPATQVKLLRVLQEKEFERVGGEETIRVDVRVIAATHRDLHQEMDQSRFREDLYYRLHILPIHLPPLRDRKKDIPLLANHFLKRLSREMRKPDLIVTQDAMRLLMSYGWPGNVRELENVLERAVVLCETNQIDADGLAFMISETKGTKIANHSLDLDSAVGLIEKQLLEQALQTAGGVKAKAARLLGIKEATLYYKLQKHGIVKRGEE
ncbi:MAG: sigma-54 dependent transcriptional regulator [bacterium]